MSKIRIIEIDTDFDLDPLKIELENDLPYWLEGGKDVKECLDELPPSGGQGDDGGNPPTLQKRKKFKIKR